MRLNVVVKDEIYQKLMEFADEEGRSISDVIRVLILNWLHHKEWEKERSKEVADGQG